MKETKRPKRPWAEPVTTHSVRLTDDETRMLGELVRRLRRSQSKVLALALRELHETRLGRKAA